MPAGRHSRLADPEFAKAVAELYTNGKTRKEMAETLGCGESSVTAWVRDPRVQAHARRFAIERSIRVCRKIDAEIEERLRFVPDWELDELLKVRKEFLDRPLKAADGEATDLGKATNEISEAMDANPDFAAELMKLAQASRAAKE